MALSNTLYLGVWMLFSILFFTFVAYSKIREIMIKLLLVEDDANLRYIVQGGLEDMIGGYRRQWRRRLAAV